MEGVATMARAAAAVEVVFTPLTAGQGIHTISRDGITQIGIGADVTAEPLDGPTPGPLTAPVFQILLSLADEELHGYAIIQDVAARTGGEVRLTPSTLYAAVKRLLDAGWIEELAERPTVERDDARRRYYRLTPRGRDAARAEARRVERLAAMARAKRLLAPAPTSPERA